MQSGEDRGFLNHGSNLAVRIISGLFGAVAVTALITTPWLAASEVLEYRRPLVAVVFSMLFLGCAVLFVWKSDCSLNRLGEKLAQTGIPTSTWLLVCVLVGLVLRIAWATAFPAPLRSDGLTYFQLASTLVREHHYISFRGELAYWPPGYPFFLFALMSILGVHTWVVLIGNLSLFAATIPLVYILGKDVVNQNVGRFAAVLITVWPNDIASASLSSKEMLVVPLVLATLLLYIRAARSSGRIARIMLASSAGAVLGLATLAHPSFQLFPAVLALYEVLRSGATQRTVRLLLLFAGMSAVIAPWAIRNHIELGNWILVSDNGGDVFYRANNPLATGGYTDRGAQLLPENEVLRNRQGYALGEQWIISHPLSFLRLAVRKLTLFLGDDSVGVYETLKRGLGVRGWSYTLFKGIANGFWVLIWMLILGMLWNRRNSALSFRPELLTLILSVMYLLPIHSVFETGSRHHVPVVGCLAILAASTVYVPFRSAPIKASSALLDGEHPISMQVGGQS